jgi:RNA polymerase sigma factor (sigma-70 family)
LNDQELLYKLKQADEPAFRWLVENYRNRIFNCVLNILHDAEEAEDATQETFIQIFESINAFKEEASLFTWIYRIAVNKALGKIKRKKTRQRLHVIMPWWMPEEKKTGDGNFQHPGIVLENKEKAGVLFKAMEALPEKQKIAFTLIKVQSMNYKEACEIMQLRVKAVESLISRAKVNLQKQLETYYNTLK